MLLLLQQPVFNKTIALTAQEKEKIRQIELSGNNFIDDVSLPKRVRHQLLSRKKIQKKLPTFYHHPDIVYPPTISLEQSSSETTATYKANLVQGKSFIDLTAGMGIDSLFFAKQFEKVVLIERNKELAEIDLHNYYVLNQTNVAIAVGIDCIDFINQYTGTVDLIYIDPARRNEEGNKVVSITAYEPNVVSILDKLFTISNHILIKTSPLLDISKAISELKYVKQVHVISVDNECKELVFYLEKDFTDEIKITTINFDKKGNQLFEYLLKDEKESQTAFSEPLDYLYEPNASIMKAGAFKIIGQQWGLKKLHPHTHLYTANDLVSDFPGRIFKIRYQGKLNKKSITTYITTGKANVAARNFPATTQAIKQKLGLIDGGEDYVFATTNLFNEKMMLICTKYMDK